MATAKDEQDTWPPGPSARATTIQGSNENTKDETSSIGAGVVPPRNKPITNTETMTTKLLHFLSTASNEKLGGIGLGLVLCTYLVLGRVGLVLIGALGGIVLQATWEGRSVPVDGAEDARKEKNLDVVRRVLDWREKQLQSREHQEADSIERSILAGRDFHDFRPETGVALSAFTEAVVQDYVKWWYNPIIPTDESFPAACRQTLTLFLRAISAHLSRKRPADAFLDFLTNSTSIIIVFLNELSSAVSAMQGAPVSAAEAVDEYLLMNPDSNLANILNEGQQKKKFKMIAEDILQNFLDKPAFECGPMRIFLKEVLASVVMEMSLSTCSKSEWINGWIVYLLEEGEPEFNQAIDVGMGNVPSNGTERNMGNSNSTKSSQLEEKRHRKRLSKAEEAMEEAMEEAKRLSQLIAEEDMRRLRSQEASVGDGTSSKPLDETLINEPREQPRSNRQNSSEMNTRTEHKSIENGSDSGSATTPSLKGGSPFTSFDQIVSPSQPTALLSDSQTTSKPSSSTLHNANILIQDDSSATDKGRIRTKPSGDYFVQIEPKSSHGWIVIRKLDDFETLHEVLRRIANISGVKAFAEQHSTLPDWKMHTKASLRGELERYLRDACWHQALADSEGMKRFLEKDQTNMQSSSSKGLGWPSPAAFEVMGKGMLDVLTSAPKGAAEGGKAVLGGVTGVLGNIGSLGQKKRESTSSIATHVAGRASTTTLPRLDSPSTMSGSRWSRSSEDSLKASPIFYSQPSRHSPIERKGSYSSMAETEPDAETARYGRVSLSSRSSMSGRISTSNSRDPSRTPSIAAGRVSSPSEVSDVEHMVLPPPPSDIPDDYGSTTESTSLSHSRNQSVAATTRTSTSTAPSLQSPSRTSLSTSTRPLLPKRPPREAIPLTEQETSVAVELLFALINELYTLSSAWNIRRTLLAAAKTYLLRPGNPSLASIQSLLQDSVIESNTSDAGIAAHLRKLRENTLPTAEELKTWPPEMPTNEKEKLRIKARKLLVERGMPAALTGVMGQAATGEALGRVFDCLQVEEVARGLIFGLLLQGIKAMTH